MKKKLTIAIASLLSASSIINAQTDSIAQPKMAPKTEVAPKKNFVVNLSEDGKRYIKFGMNAQIWGRYAELNPGSSVGSNPTKESFDIVIRRLRLQAMGMLTEKVFFHVQLGQNNLNFTQNTNPYNAPLSVMDLLGEYHFSSKLHLGGGLTGWGAGTTRYSAQSSSSQLSLDAPIYQQNVNTSSTYGNRNYSIYAKGQIAKFSYNAVITNPYAQSNKLNSSATTPSPLTPSAQYKGMLTYSFLDKESNTEPYVKGTYLGTKKVFNIGVGYMYQKNAMWRRASAAVNADTVKHDMNVFGADLFYDAPVGSKGAAVTVYAAYNNCDYGQNYTRMISTPNPASVGSGAGFIGVGTGNIFYSQVGYLFRKNSDETKKARTQLYASTEVASLQALKTPMVMYEAGINYYFAGSWGPKVSLGYQDRSVFGIVAGEAKQVEITRKGMLVLQYQISF
jgi:hypothetical protein